MRWGEQTTTWMSEAQQGFHADHAASDHDNGLVVENQMVFLQGLRHHFPYQKVMVQNLVEVRAVQAVLVAPRALGGIEGEVGVAHERLGIGIVKGKEGDAEAAGNAHHLSIAYIDGRAQCLQNALTEGFHVIHAFYVDEEDGELVPTQAGERIHRPQDGLHLSGQLLQNLVSGAVPVAVVDLLEAVEIEQRHPEQPFLPPGMATGVFQAVEKQGAIG